MNRRAPSATAYAVHRDVEVNDPTVAGPCTPIIGVFLTEREAIAIEERNPRSGITWTELEFDSTKDGENPPVLFVGVEVDPSSEDIRIDPTPRSAFTDRDLALRWAKDPGPKISHAKVLAIPVGQLDWEGKSWAIE